MNKIKTMMKNERGMTLIELLAVIVIIAIIALIAIPAIGNIIANSKDKAILSDASQIISGAKIAFADGGCASTTVCNGAELKGYVEGEAIKLEEKTTTVTKAGEVYTIVYAGFGDLSKDGKFNKEIKNNTISSTELAKLMGNK
ncbi:prepilin-type N-terminal cleavage/methylation domain-containing protein [Viridibacillus sp. NPDC093762]|uniref:prepilin-type N-terminal cleavage/methylation domain-containing protein n=1 Tax=Viridibacillus sp. NPDC093762 TaxID=3390720 RepID=UPI003D059CFE